MTASFMLDIKSKKMATATDLKTFYEEIKEIMKCPICLDHLQGPIFECHRGHPVCLSCKSRLTCCATCRAEFNSARTTILSQIMDVLPLACNNIGCNVFSTAGAMHERYCAYRPYKALCCSKVIPLRNLHSHYVESHPRRCVFKLGSKYGHWPNISLQESAEITSLFFCFGQYFWRKMIVDHEKKLFTVTFGCVPSSAITRSFWVNIQFIRNQYQVINSFPIPVLENDRTMESLEPCLVLGLHQVKHFIDNSGNLKFYKMDIKYSE